MSIGNNSTCGHVYNYEDYNIDVDSLSENNLSEDDARTLSEILKVHTKLKDLKLVFSVDVIATFMRHKALYFLSLRGI